MAKSSRASETGRAMSRATCGALCRTRFATRTRRTVAAQGPRQNPPHFPRRPAYAARTRSKGSTMNARKARALDGSSRPAEETRLSCHEKNGVAQSGTLSARARRCMGRCPSRMARRCESSDSIELNIGSPTLAVVPPHQAVPVGLDSGVDSRVYSKSRCGVRYKLEERRSKLG